VSGSADAVRHRVEQGTGRDFGGPMVPFEAHKINSAPSPPPPPRRRRLEFGYPCNGCKVATMYLNPYQGDGGGGDDDVRARER